MADTTKGFKIWLPRAWTPRYAVEIDGTDVTSDVLSGEFTNGIIGVDAECKVTLIDATGSYASTYVGGETIEFKCDNTDGTTSRWKGTLERPKKKFGTMYELELIGSSYQSDFLDLTVTEAYKDQTADEVLKSIVSKYLSGYTVTNIASSTTEVTIKWNNKPFYDCIIDLCEIAGFDCYVDTDKDFHFFEQESNINASEVVNWKDNLMAISNFGTDNIDVKNRIIVYGEDESGNTIIYQADDSASQATYGIKEKIIKDSSIRTYEQAKNLGDGTLSAEKEKSNKGEFTTLIIPAISPGDMIWLTHGVLDIHGTFRLIKYTHTIPILQTKIVVSKDKTIPSLFKERKKSDLAKENITNPFKMTGSLNLTFDTTDDYDATASSDITIEESNLKVASGKSSGVMVSKRRTSTSNITKVHLQVKEGDFLSGATFYVSANDGGDWEEIKIEDEYSINAVGTNLRLKISLSSVNTRIGSVALLYR